MGTGLGVVGGLIPSPLHLIALTQVALNRWSRAILILVGLPLVIDGSMLLATLFFYQYIPHNIVHGLAYVGGVALLALGSYSLLQDQRKSQEELASSSTLTYAGVSAALLAEFTAPGTWIYWLTIAVPVLAEGQHKGYWHVVPFFGGGLVGYYGASLISVWVMAWGASLHHQFKRYLFLIANVLLLILGVSYLIHAYIER